MDRPAAEGIISLSGGGLHFPWHLQRAVHLEMNRGRWSACPNEQQRGERSLRTFETGQQLIQEACERALQGRVDVRFCPQLAEQLEQQRHSTLAARKDKRLSETSRGRGRRANDSMAVSAQRGGYPDSARQPGDFLLDSGALNHETTN